MSTNPADHTDQPAQAHPAPAVPDEPLLPGRSADDSDRGWNDGEDSNDERLRREVPPHW